MIADDALIGNVVNQITTFPSEQYVYYAPLGNSYNIVIAGWGCSLMGNQCEENVKITQILHIAMLHRSQLMKGQRKLSQIIQRPTNGILVEEQEF